MPIRAKATFDVRNKRSSVKKDYGIVHTAQRCAEWSERALALNCKQSSVLHADVMQDRDKGAISRQGCDLKL